MCGALSPTEATSGLLCRELDETDDHAMPCAQEALARLVTSMDNPLRSLTEAQGLRWVRPLLLHAYVAPGEGAHEATESGFAWMIEDESDGPPETPTNLSGGPQRRPTRFHRQSDLCLHRTRWDWTTSLGGGSRS